MYKALILALVLCEPVLAAGWSAAYWPAHTHPTNGWNQWNEAYTAVLERARVVDSGTSWPQEPANILGGARSGLSGLKNALKVSITGTASPAPKWRWLNPDYMAASEPFGQTWYLSQTNLTNGVVVSRPPVATTTGLLWSLTLPTNYFEWSPPFGWSGLGPFTNDTTVGHPHGYTNEYTVKGGTNFPAGRSTWYDTDYGIAGITAVVSKLIYTDDRNAPYDTTSVATYPWSRGVYGDGYYGGNVAYSNTWAAATNAADVRYALDPTWRSVYAYDWDALIGTLGAYQQGPIGYGASIWSKKVYPGVTLQPTNYAAHVEFYVHCASNGYYANTYVFDTHGQSGLTVGIYAYWDDAVKPVDTNSVYCDTVIGTDAKPSPWCSEPTTPATDYTARGWRFNARAVLCWTNGFTFY